MEHKEIVSLQHPLVKEWVELRLEKQARLRTHSVLLIGEKMVRELSKQGKLSALLTLQPSSTPAHTHYIVTEAVLQKVTGLKSPDGWAAIAPLPPPVISFQKREKILILDQISDPGNLGTLLRTALALGWDGVIFTPGTVDPFNDKALRASKGALFHLPYQFQTTEEIEMSIHAPLLVADPHGEDLANLTITPPFALVLSHEGAGLSAWSEKKGKKIQIPMQNGVDSLNVAASGAIFLYML
jgi:TrmH family RNA methyltransferase